MSTTYWNAAVTAFWVSPRFKYPRTQNAGVFGVPSGDTQNAKSELNKRLRQVHLLLIITRKYASFACKGEQLREVTFISEKKTITYA